ncbi:MAG TPA: hypothetical protein ENN41_11090 [Sediminispirochaeta sp.]|nr:hypothetical protein [Sediminispirochaeta sp.]
MEDKKAVALKYYGDLPAPFVTAKGKGPTAERMLKLARENGVPVQDSRDLAQLLFAVDLGDFIPEELYELVAQLYAFVLEIQDEL